MDHCVSANVNDSCVTKQTVGASTDKEVDSLRGRIRGRWRIADETERVRLKACDPATRANEGHHSRTMRSGSGTLTRTKRMWAPSNDARGNPVSYTSPSRTSTCGSARSVTTHRANTAK